MKNVTTRKSIQSLVSVSYLVIMILYGIGVLIPDFKKEFLPITLLCVISVTSIFLLFCMVCKCVTDRIQAHGLIVAVNLILLISVVNGDIYYVPIGLLITAIIICIYEQLWINKNMLIQTICLYLVTLAIQIVTGNRSSRVVFTYFLMGIVVIMVEVILCIIIDHIEKYTRLIKENSRSSQDMLKVVELKRQEAQNAAKAKTMFLSNMSHEIRTPINAILGMDEIILRESNESNVIEFASKIQSAGNTLLSLVNDILDFSKIESGKMEIVEEEYDFELLLNDIYNLLCLRTEEKGLFLNFEIAEDVPRRLNGDVLRLKQVLLNVLSNGVKYTEKGSVTLKIDWRQKYPGLIKLLISVEDTGIGIKKEDQQRLFNAFERVGDSGSKHIEGTGLGMSITKSLLDIMKGTIAVKSEFGQGSTFYIQINQKVMDYTPVGKLANKTRHGVMAKRYKESFVAPDAKILIVDDNEMNLMVVKGLLKKTRIQIDLAVSGRQCLEMVKKLKYDIIFMDHMMPEMDGIETFHQLQSMEENLSREAAVVALTANAIAGAKDFYLGKGFLNYLSKPINSGKMETMIRNILPEELVMPTTLEEVPDIAMTQEHSSIHYGAGLTFAGNDVVQYEDNMRMFLQAASEKKDLIRKHAEQEDWNSYTIEVHALKSNAAYIGAEALSEVAFEHEHMGKAFNAKGITDSLPRLMKVWDQALMDIGTLMVHVESKIPESKGIIITDEEYFDLIQKAIDHLNDFESDAAIVYIRQLLEYELSEDRRRVIKKAYDEIDKFNYKSAARILFGE